MAGTDPTLRDVLQPGGDAHSGAGAATTPDPPLGDTLSLELKNAGFPPSAVLGAVNDSLGTFLDIRLSTVMAGAWSKAQLLKQARDKSIAAPEETFLLSMAKHSIQTKYKPSIDMLVNGKTLDSLPFEIGVKLTLEGLVLKIQAGVIRELRPGKCEASGTITCRGYPLADRKVRAIDLPGVLTLGEGVPIAGSADRDSVAPPGSSGGGARSGAQRGAPHQG